MPTAKAKPGKPGFSVARRDEIQQPAAKLETIDDLLAALPCATRQEILDDAAASLQAENGEPDPDLL